jgi:hypothetical protein
VDDNKKTFVFAGSILAILLAVGGAIFLAQSDSEDARTQDDQPAQTDSWLQPWSIKDSTATQITWSASAGPTAALPGHSIQLSPPDFSWSSESSGSTTLLRGEADDGTRLVWEFADGNPTAVLRVERTIPASALSKPMAVHLSLPNGQLEGWNARRGFHGVDAYRSNSGQPQWLRWQSDSASLTFRGWTGDNVLVEPATGGGFGLRLGMWAPEDHPRVLECLGEMQQSDVTLEGRLLVEFRMLPKLAVWPYPDAAEAMLLPIFLAPELHSDPQLGEAKSRHARDFAERVTTLAYGHSSAKDPRYGNGGLLGHGLGGTVVAPERLLGKRRVQRLAADLAPTRVDIAAGGPVTDDAPYQTRYSSEVSCNALRSPHVAGLISPASDESPAAFRGAPAPFEMQIFSRLLDGRLDSLLAQGFSRAYADEAVRNRDIYAFASPLVATRNPLIGAAADAVLEPERDGMWTVAPRLAGGLADVELWREEHPIGVSSVDDLVSYRTFSRDAALTWTENGAPQISGSKPGNQIGYTIALEGEAALPESLSPPPSVHVANTKNGPVTLLAWDAAPDTTSLALRRDLGNAAVEWVFVQE